MRSVRTTVQGVGWESIYSAPAKWWPQCKATQDARQGKARQSLRFLASVWVWAILGCSRWLPKPLSRTGQRVAGLQRKARQILAFFCKFGPVSAPAVGCGSLDSALAKGWPQCKATQGKGCLAPVLVWAIFRSSLWLRKPLLRISRRVAAMQGKARQGKAREKAVLAFLLSAPAVGCGNVYSALAKG